jgi:nitrite reductase/ring-hydroxylating ferredoxin subunit/uncharacterized membrane protein
MSRLEPLVRAIDSASVLDAPAKAVAGLVRKALPAGAIKDAVSGTWLGHAVHPMLTDVVIGSFLSSTLLDVVGGKDADQASRRLISVGIAAYGPTALTGLSDWTDAEFDDEKARRSGLVHATTNALALSMYTASLAARRRGSRRAGVALGFAGAALLSGAGYLGGHLTLRRGIGADQTVFDPGPTDWTPVTDADQLEEGKLTRVIADETPVLLLKNGDEIYAIHDRCSHRGCSLSWGNVEGEEIVCACHGSRFDKRTGALRHGPATASQPAFQVRRQENVVEVRWRSSTSL